MAFVECNQSSANIREIAPCLATVLESPNQSWYGEGFRGGARDLSFCVIRKGHAVVTNGLK